MKEKKNAMHRKHRIQIVVHVTYAMLDFWVRIKTDYFRVHRTKRRFCCFVDDDDNDHDDNDDDNDDDDDVN